MLILKAKQRTSFPNKFYVLLEKTEFSNSPFGALRRLRFFLQVKVQKLAS